jgi:hypothetical protein
MELRDFLIEMYLKHGEREFAMTHPERVKTPELYGTIMKCRTNDRYIRIRHTMDQFYMYTLTPAAIKLIKEGTE